MKKDEVEGYSVIGHLGTGSYGKVNLVKKDGRLFAMKQIEKRKLLKQGKSYQAFIEKQLLRKINHEGIIKLIKSFQDGRNLYYILEYCHGGDFINYIKSNNQYFTEKMRVFYIAEIVQIVEFLHKSGITHRDLKPENILLARNGHIKLIDFGTAEITRCTIIDEAFKESIVEQKKKLQKQVSEQELSEGSSAISEQLQDEQMSPRKRKSTFVGTPYYISPELLQHNICEASSDLWALGVIIYQLYYLKTPFTGYQAQVYQQIKRGQYTFPPNDILTDQAKDLITRLLVKIPEKRLGSNQGEGLMFSDLKAHPYFKGINFEHIFEEDAPEINDQIINQTEIQFKTERLLKQVKENLSEIIQQEGKIVMSGVVEKKTFSSFLFSYFVLYEDFKMIEILSSKIQQVQKVDLGILGEGVVAEKLTEDKFRMIGNQCFWKIRTQQAEEWVNALNNEYIKLNK